MALEILSRQDLDDFKKDLIQEIRNLNSQTTTDVKEVLKSVDVRKLLGISHGTLQTLRINGTLPYTKLGGTLYYYRSDVEKVLLTNKKS